MSSTPPFTSRTRISAAITVKGVLKPGEYLIIPGYDPNPNASAIPVAKDFEVRAIYMTGAMAGGRTGLSIIQRWRAAGGNAVVFDIKDSDGSVSIHFDNPLAPHQKYTPIHNLPKFLRYLHQQNLHAIARIAIFRDENIANNHTELTIHSAKTGEAGMARERQTGLDRLFEPAGAGLQHRSCEVRSRSGCG